MVSLETSVFKLRLKTPFKSLKLSGAFFMYQKNNYIHVSEIYGPKDFLENLRRPEVRWLAF